MLPLNAQNAIFALMLDEECLFLHLVDKVVSCDGELLLDHVAHCHKIFQALLKYCIHTDAIWGSVSETAFRSGYCEGAHHKFGCASSSLLQTDVGWNNRKTQHLGWEEY
jgi:hypothetical protein